MAALRKKNVDFSKEDRDVLINIKHPELMKWAKLQQKVLWFMEELDWSTDKNDFDSLHTDVQHVILMIVGFFSVSDQLVIDNLIDNFNSEIKTLECRYFYTVQGYIESVHSETYAEALKILAPPKHPIKEACKASPSINAKAKWAKKYMASDIPFIHRLFAFVCFEGVLFQGSFCILYWMKRLGKCKGLYTSNDFIARDEAIHSLFGLEMVNLCHTPIKASDAFKIMNEAIECEKEFIRESFVLEGRDVQFGELNEKSVLQYVKSCANGIMSMVTNTVDDESMHDYLYEDAANPFNFMDLVKMSTKVNFFESTEFNYVNQAGSSAEDNSFGLDADF